MEESILSWDHVASAFGAITTLLLTYLISRLGKIEEKQEEHINASNKELNDRVTFKNCKDFREECERLKHQAVECDVSATKKRVEQVQENLDVHSHTGLPGDSAVIKRRNFGNG